MEINLERTKNSDPDIRFNEDPVLALKLFEQRYGDSLRSYAFRFQLPYHLSPEDLVQEALIKILVLSQRKPPNLPTSQSLRNYLLRTIHNLATDSTRRRTAFAESLDFNENSQIMQIADSSANTEGIVITKETQQSVQSTFHTLLPRHKQALFLADVQQLSYVEASRIMKVSVPTFKSLLYRARANFRKQYLNDNDQTQLDSM